MSAHDRFAPAMRREELSYEELEAIPLRPGNIRAGEITRRREREWRQRVDDRFTGARSFRVRMIDRERFMAEWVVQDTHVMVEITGEDLDWTTVCAKPFEQA